MAFAPDYGRSRRFYVFFIDRRNRIRVDELRRSLARPDRATLVDAGRCSASTMPARFTTVASWSRSRRPPLHQHWLHQRRSRAAESREPQGQGPGSIPRPSGEPYFVPHDNPFDCRGSARPEIWAYGLRDPYRFSFDRGTGALLVGDVGGDRSEEVNLVRRGRAAGANFGWSKLEGRKRIADGPAKEHFTDHRSHHASGWCSIVAATSPGSRPGSAVRALPLRQGLQRTHLRGTGLLKATSAKRLQLTVPYLVSFGEDARRRLAHQLRRPCLWIASNPDPPIFMRRESGAASQDPKASYPRPHFDAVAPWTSQSGSEGPVDRTTGRASSNGVRYEHRA